MEQMLEFFFIIYQTMSKKQRDRFKKFILFRIPSFDRANSLIAILDTLFGKDADKEVNDDTLVRLKRSTPDGTNAQCNRLVHDLKDLIEDFLAHEQLDQQAWEKDHLLANALLEYSSFEHFADQANEITQKIEDKIKKGYDLEPTDFLVISVVNKRLFFHPNTNKFKQEANSLHRSSLNLDKYYVHSKLRIITDVLSRQLYLSNQTFVEFDDLLKVAAKFDEPVFQLYVKLLPIFEVYDDNYFSSLLSDLKRDIKYLALFDKSVFIEKMLYIANKAFELGKTEYSGYFFELIQIADEHDVIISNNSIDPIYFLNAVSIAVNANQLTWALYFIKKYHSFLKNDCKYDTIILAIAYCRFADGKYHKIIKNVKRLEKSSFFAIRLQAKTLRLRIYYELAVQDDSIEDYYDAFDRHCRALIRFMDREKELNQSKKLAIKNFIRILDRFLLFTRNPGKTKKDLSKMKEALLTKNPIIAKAWLLKKCEELPAYKNK